MKTFSDTATELKNLKLKPYKLIDIVKIILSCQSLQEEGLFDNCPIANKKAFWKDKLFPQDYPYKKDMEKKFPQGLLDCYVQITYQRVIKLEKIRQHLKRKALNGTEPLGFDKALAGAIDIAVRPGKKAFIWDGFRRSIIAIINGVRFPSHVLTNHSTGFTDERCEEYEAHWFKIRNGDSENMPKEELYKAGIVYKDSKSMKVLGVLQKMGADVIGTNPGADNPELHAFSLFQDFVLKGVLDTDYLVQASWKQKEAWPNDNSLTGYLLCGLAKFLEAIENIPHSGEVGHEYGSFGLTPVHPNEKGTCDVAKKLIAHAKKGFKQTSLTSNRLSGKTTESVAYFIGSKVMELTRDQLQELARRLGFDMSDTDTLNYLSLQSLQK